MKMTHYILYALVALLCNMILYSKNDIYSCGGDTLDWQKLEHLLLFHDLEKGAEERDLDVTFYSPALHTLHVSIGWWLYC